MPVPSVIITISRQPLPPPLYISPSAATFASFPAFTFKPDSFENSSSMLNTPQPKFTALKTVPSFFTGPGRPIPIPSTSSLSIESSLSFDITESYMSLSMLLPLSVVSVFISQSSLRTPSHVKKPILTVVPPISIPNTYFFISHPP